jgi:hypothetical protein
LNKASVLVGSIASLANTFLASVNLIATSRSLVVITMMPLAQLGIYFANSGLGFPDELGMKSSLLSALSRTKTQSPLASLSNHSFVIFFNILVIVVIVEPWYVDHLRKLTTVFVEPDRVRTMNPKRIAWLNIT